MYLTNDDDEEEEEEGEKDNDDDENILKSASKFNGKKKRIWKQKSSYFPSITRECKLYVFISILFLQFPVSKSPT